MRRHVSHLIVGAVYLASACVGARDDCSAAVDSLVAEGWSRYRQQNVDEAHSHFEHAEQRCEEHVGARVGLGYAALRSQQLDQSRRWWGAVLADDSTVIDALFGMGIVEWREGNLERSRSLFESVMTLDSTHAEAGEYLTRLPSAAFEPLVRSPLVRPDTVMYPARTNADRFEIRTDAGWAPFYIKGVNLGAALPGKHPSEFPDSAQYADWIGEMAAMGANTVRVYTIHPPWFYQALLEYNAAHPGAPLWLIHGVWTGLPPDHTYDNNEWEAGFFAEMRRVVDVLHGRADIEPRPGHAWGHFTADVSPWVLAYIIGREWEPFSVVEFNEQRHGSAWPGAYVAGDGNAMEAWLAKACDEMISYEMERYHAQRPIAYTNWPTLDPLWHASEMPVADEVAHRESLGEIITQLPKEYDNDLVGLDANRMRATEKFPAGVFAAYHAYPYYPDFMFMDPAYADARSSFGPSNYIGYLRALKTFHANVPVVIAEYGVPASLGNAHLQPQGLHHGGHTERAMASIDARLTREIAEAGLAGGAIFAWIDEWFKKNWIVIEYEIPAERTGSGSTDSTPNNTTG